MLLGSRLYATSDVRVIRINYCDWLTPGYTLQDVVASIPTTGVTSTVGGVTLDPENEAAFITVNCGTVVNESFVLNITAQDTLGQTITDQLNITIVSPGAT